ncbi:MAG TPA: hypothetical protein VFD73_20750, partial [Gemmatimonadales bacterium]|nr:hypothetical protein [Gemmatimonadales bacterium]
MPGGVFGSWAGTGEVAAAPGINRLLEDRREPGPQHGPGSHGPLYGLPVLNPYGIADERGLRCWRRLWQAEAMRCQQRSIALGDKAAMGEIRLQCGEL